MSKKPANKKFKKEEVDESFRQSCVNEWIEKSEEYETKTTEGSTTSLKPTSYSSFTPSMAEQFIGETFQNLDYNSIELNEFLQIIKRAYLTNDEMGDLSDNVTVSIYQNLINKFKLYEYPLKTNLKCNEFYLQDLVGVFIEPVLLDLKEKNENRLVIRRESCPKEVKEKVKKVMLKTEKLHASGKMEFVVKIQKWIEKTLENHILETEIDIKEVIVLIAEVKKSDIIKGQCECLVALKDAFDNSGENIPVFGIVTTVFEWRFFVYDGNTFIATKTIDNVIPSKMVNMVNDKENWIRGSALTICRLLYAIYSIGLNLNLPN